MQSRELFAAGALAIVLFACDGMVIRSRVPQETRGQTAAKYAGPIRLRITNETPEPLCKIQLDERSRNASDNWIPSGSIPPGGSTEFRVKSGKYTGYFLGCNGRWEAALGVVKLETDRELVLYGNSACVGRS